MKHLTAILLAFLCLSPAVIAITPQSAMVNAPREVISAIDSLTRLDMIDYYESGSSVASRNDLGGTSSIKLITDEAVTVSTSGSSEVTIALLSSPRDTAIMVINTLALPAPDSRVTIYDRDWNKLGSKAQLPDHNNLDMWLLPTTREQRETVENAVPFIPAIYSYSNGRLDISHTLSRLLTEDGYKTVKPLLKPSISYTWNGKKWTLVK